MSRAYPPGHILRELVLSQPDVLTNETFLARCDDWLRLADLAEPARPANSPTTPNATDESENGSDSY
jgi:hypothetical protein